MTATVAVTGGKGRTGRNLLAYLNDEGYRTVNLWRGKQYEPHSDSFLTPDLIDAGEMYGSLAKSDADAVVQLSMLPAPKLRPGYETPESNVMSSYHVPEAAGEFGIDTATLAPSFSAVGGGYKPDPVTVDYLPVDEEYRLTPSTSYGLGKQSLEIAADGFPRHAENAPERSRPCGSPGSSTTRSPATHSSRPTGPCPSCARLASCTPSATRCSRTSTCRTPSTSSNGRFAPTSTVTSGSGFPHRTRAPR